MPQYEIVLRNVDDGTESSIASDAVVAGEQDEWSVVVSGEAIVSGSASKTSGN